MINNEMKYYKYYKYQDKNKYGQLTLSNEAFGDVKIAIYTTSNSIQDNINYKDASYIGLTHSNVLSDKCAIQYGDIKLKVLYIIPYGRLNQVFLKEI